MNRLEFRESVHALAKEVGVIVVEIHLRSMRNKWASCSARGRLTFDPKVLEIPDSERKRIVLHELLHLRYPNHGRMFHLMMETYGGGG